MENDTKQFPDGMQPLGDEKFNFDCHPGVSCFTVCCKKVDLTLYPYDIIRMKNGLKLDSEEFIRNHTFLVKGDNLFFPTVKLKLREENNACPFLSDEGCKVYSDRPSACRTYPLERAVDRSVKRGLSRDFYFMTDHSYCHGHKESKQFDVRGWLRNQKLLEYNSMNSLWAEIDTIFATNPWKGEGAAGEKQQMAFMVCYNIDGFRRFAQENLLLKQFRLDRAERRRIERDDADLLKFGFDWLKLMLVGKSRLIRK